ncbi:hypothetical protein C8J56DRAFT_880859 [Mycena floridula]|nr:hypothetical protein C8J56DRAFT_880859 [Mycena floridula]
MTGQRLVGLGRFHIKPVPGIPSNQQQPGVYLHPTEPDMIVTISSEREPMSPYMDASAAEEAAIEAEMAKFDEPARKAIDAAVAWYNLKLFIQDAFPTSDMTKEWAIHALKQLKRPARMGQEEPVDITPVPLVQRQGLLYLEHGKNELRTLVIGRYHLRPQAEQAVQSALITDLLQDSTFLHKVRGITFKTV